MQLQFSGYLLVEHAAGIARYVENMSTYSIDWEVADNICYMAHLLANNLHKWINNNPFQVGPPQLSHVPCESPNCPLTPQQVQRLDQALASRVNLQSRSMDIRRIVWLEAYNICNELFS